MPQTTGDYQSFLDNVLQMTTSTPANGTTFDAVHQQLLNNDTFLSQLMAGIVREAIPSGVFRLASVSAGLTATPNAFTFAQDEANVDGFKIPLGSTNTVQLDAPPAVNVTPALPGSARDDLVFAEFWRSTTGAWKWRIRKADGVDFGTYPVGFKQNTTVWYANFTTNTSIPWAQGGNSAPVLSTSNTLYSFHQANPSDDPNAPLNLYSDAGLYIAGTGSAQAQLDLNTVDGYVYAIPLFRVRRRNTTAYNADTNPFGGAQYQQCSFSTAGAVSDGSTTTVTLITGDATVYEVGQYLYTVSGKAVSWKITAIQSSTSMTVQAVGNIAVVTSGVYYGGSDRPDGLYSNVIYLNTAANESDIVDLRHQVSPTGFNNQALLEKNLDLLLRGQLNTVDTPRYTNDNIGLNLSGYTDDVNTLLYCNFDGSINGTANGVAVAGTMSTGSPSFVNGVQGEALAPSNTAAVSYPVAIASGVNTYAIEFLFKPQWNWNDGAYHALVDMTGASGLAFKMWKDTSNLLQCQIYNGASYVGSVVGTLPSSVTSPIQSGSAWHKILFSNNNGVVTVLIDNVLIPLTGYTSNFPALPFAVTNFGVGISSGAGYANAAFDLVRISNIARTETLLPANFDPIYMQDRILDGPMADFNYWSDDMGGITGVNGRTNPYGLTHVPNQMAARVNYNGAEVRHYFGTGITPGAEITSGWTTGYLNPLGSYDSSAEYVLVQANETVDGSRTAFTFTKPTSASGIVLITESSFSNIVMLNGNFTPASSISSVSTDASGRTVVVFTVAPTGGTAVAVVYVTAQRHAHFVPSTKGFMLHDWTDDAFTAINGALQTTKYNVTAVNYVGISNITAPTAAPSVAAGGSGATIPTGTYYASIAWVTAAGYSMVSATSPATVTLGEEVTFAAVILPSWATGVVTYLSTAPGTPGTVQTVLTGQTPGASVTPTSITAYATETAPAVTSTTTRYIQNGGYTVSGLNSRTTLAASAALSATTISLTSASNFVDGQNIRIQKGDGTWLTTTITSGGATTTLTVPALASSLNQNAVIEGAAVVTFTETTGTTWDTNIVYESVITPSEGDYLRIAYQHTPYQGTGITRQVGIEYVEKKQRVTSFGTGKVNVGAGRFTYPMSVMLPIGTSVSDALLKGDALATSMFPSGRGTDFWLSGIPSVDYNSTANYGEAYAGDSPIWLSATGKRGEGAFTASTNFGSASEPLTAGVPHLAFQAFLAVDVGNGEVYLGVVTAYLATSSLFTYVDGTSNNGADLFKLQGRPLIKNYGGVTN